MQIKDQNPAQYEWGIFPFGEGRRILDIRYEEVFKAVLQKKREKRREEAKNFPSYLVCSILRIIPENKLG